MREELRSKFDLVPIVGMPVPRRGSHGNWFQQQTISRDHSVCGGSRLFDAGCLEIKIGHDSKRQRLHSYPSSINHIVVHDLKQRGKSGAGNISVDLFFSSRVIVLAGLFDWAMSAMIPHIIIYRSNASILTHPASSIQCDCPSSQRDGAMQCSNSNSLLDNRHPYWGRSPVRNRHHRIHAILFGTHYYSLERS